MWASCTPTKSACSRGSDTVEVFVAAGPDRWHDAQALRAHELVQLVPTPRHATVLLVAGTIGKPFGEALDRVHDQLPHPRTVVTWDEVAVANTVISLLYSRRVIGPMYFETTTLQVAVLGRCAAVSVGVATVGVIAVGVLALGRLITSQFLP